ncbi:hypothetical protein U8527_14260 [Kordia algicida OT-1]|uniref:Uncharacterized protein n=1 Tax=Kordia algicida OT-1 TaxID=391587 RepID=A9DY04_9FLAO|nr:hypothetical protein [Kordia algicida]EDP96069.1 hypothetical protein KAOT1_07868 [Kordia algicida OT-1]
MDPEKELQRISDQHNGEFTVEESIVEGDSGSQLNFVKYHLKMIHNDASLVIVYDFGNYIIATYTINIQNIKNAPEFNFSTIDHFTKLILLKNQHWKLRCKATYLKEKIEILFRKHQLDQLMQRTAFEPTIKGMQMPDSYKIHTTFSLNFEENTKSIQTIFSFHKELIDTLKEKFQSFRK